MDSCADKALHDLNLKLEDGLKFLRLYTEYCRKIEGPLDTQWGYKVVEDDDTPEMYFFVEGTISKADWISNLRFLPKWSEAAGVWTHRGLMRKAEAISPFVGDLVREFRPRRVVIAGHSAGGSIALLLRSLLIEECALEAANIEVFTFGAARPFFWKQTPENGAWGKAVWNFVIWGDPVPKLLKFLGYKVWGSVLVCPGFAVWEEDDSIYDYATRMFELHQVLSYQEALETL